MVRGVELLMSIQCSKKISRLELRVRIGSLEVTMRVWVDRGQHTVLFSLKLEEGRQSKLKEAGVNNDFKKASSCRSSKKFFEFFLSNKKVLRTAEIPRKRKSKIQESWENSPQRVQTTKTTNSNKNPGLGKASKKQSKLQNSKKLLKLYFHSKNKGPRTASQG